MLPSTLRLEFPTLPRNPLLIPELFQCILDDFAVPHRELGIDSLSSRAQEVWEARRALAALARTCHALSEPSLNRLWHRLDSLKPLIRCFATVVDEHRTETPISSAEWAIIERYSSRIQELVIFPSCVDNQILRSVSNCSQSPFILPNLKILQWAVPTEDSQLPMIMRRLLSSSLVSLVVFVSRRRGIETFLQNYATLCPRLKLKSVNFDIIQCPGFGGKVSLSEIHQLSQAICIHQHLESLSTSIPVDDVALRYIMLSPQLRRVSLVLHPMESNLHNIRIAPADIPFRNVKDLELLVWDFQFAVSLLGPMDQTFHTFRLHSSDLHEARIVFLLLTSLASPQRVQSLQSISLTRSNSYALSHEIIIFSYCPTIHHLTYATLCSLTIFRYLRELELCLFNEIVLSDEELADLSRSWPMLEVLRFNCSSAGACHTPVASLTLEGLLSLLVLCPRLRRLMLSLDAREVPHNTSTDVCSTVLTHLALPDSPIHDARLVADFLSKHLPSVTSIEGPFRDVQYIPWWLKVNEYLEMD